MDSVSVAVGGHIDRDDKCQKCGTGMIFRVDDSGRVTSKFCGNMDGDSWCPKALVEIPE